MKLPPGEKSILAYFPSSNSAQKAKEALQKAGFGKCQVDRISRYGAEINAAINNPSNRADSNTGLTLYSSGNSENLNDDEGVLLNADPSSSGYGDAGYGTAGGKAFLLTLVATEDKTKRAEEIIKRNGGKI